MIRTQAWQRIKATFGLATFVSSRLLSALSLLLIKQHTVGFTPRRTVFLSPIFRSPSYTLANLGSKRPLPDLDCAAVDAAPGLDAGAAPAPAPSASPTKGLMYSLSSLAPSSQVIRSRRSMKPKFCTLPEDPAAASWSLSVVAEALYSGMASSRFSQAK